MSAARDFEVVIGLEVHAQLRTASKLFSPAPVSYGLPPNHSVHPICLALPGVLPVLNRHAVELAIRAGLATHGEVRRHSVFARKNYFYPDLPKGYQISQYEEPVISGGWLDIAVEDASFAQRAEGERSPSGGASSRTQRVRLVRIHLEEDAGKSIHDPAIAGGATHVDLNRAGVPLLEIVSEPDMRSAAEAVAYLRTLRSVLRYIDVSDADMERGHLRCDVNVSLRPRGSEALGTRTEIKNLNSFRAVEAALAAEIRRQADLLDSGGAVVQATMAFDPDTGRTRVLRRKENADDYRYFPDPDLVPLVLSEAEIEAVRAALPELADARCARYQRDFALSEYDARALTASRALADLFEGAVDQSSTARAKPIANWLLRDVQRVLNDRELEIESARITPRALADLVDAVESGKTTVQSARGLIPELVERGGDPIVWIRERGLETVSDTDVIARAVDEVIRDHPADVERVRAGEAKVLNFLIGQVMKRTAGKASPQTVRELLAARITP
jgi:aspartyl-tRNA(Asn)/glutamyl-tRNA(Gln) amidotransferase subunit B